MNCPTCDEPYLVLESEGAKVCGTCGYTVQSLFVTPTKYGEDVNICIYSRSKRFEMMLRALLYPSFDKKDTIMYKHLAHKKRFATITELETEMKRCQTKEKRFHSVHLFAKLLCDNYKPIQPPPINFFKSVMIAFDEVLCRFNAQRSANFFSYPWLIRTLLNLRGETRYNRFIKIIRCKKRNIHYKNMFQSIIDASPTTYRIREWGTIKWG
jgi:hypothetical protein